MSIKSLKNSKWVLTIVSLSLYVGGAPGLGLAQAADATTDIAQSQDGGITSSEFKREKDQIRLDYAQVKKYLSDLDSFRAGVVSRLKKQGETENQWIDSLKQYDLILSVRYSDEKGEYQGGLELKSNDVENLNKLFDGYLHSRPLQGKVSVEEARKSIVEGIEKLQALSKIHGDPTDSNSSDLEIVAKQRMDAEARIKKMTEVASKLGFDVTSEPAIADSHRAPNRTPSSDAPVSGK